MLKLDRFNSAATSASARSATSDENRASGENSREGRTARGPTRGARKPPSSATPADVACARAIGARAVIVATGLVSRKELLAAEPDVHPGFLRGFEGTLTPIALRR